MAVHIRLSRAGAKKAPFYRIVVADQRCPRGGRFIERVGIYDPRQNPVELRLDRTRIGYWIDRGAVASATVEKLLRKPSATIEAGAAAAS